MTWLRDLTNFWRQRIQEAKDAKEDQFDADARLLWKFLNASYEDLYIATTTGADSTTIGVYMRGGPYYKPRINKCQEFVDLYMPYVLARNPQRRVWVRRPQFPPELIQNAALAALVPYNQYDKRTRLILETAAQLLEWWIQYCADEYDVLREARLAVIEALVKGRGVMWHGLISTASGLMPASFFESVDNIYIDPQATTLRDAGYLIRRRRLSSWQAASILGVDEEKLVQMAGVKSQPADSSEPRSGTSDIVEYYEIYSRIGIGVSTTEVDSSLREWRDALDSLGQYVFLAIANGGEHPLNIDPDRIRTASDLAAAVQWPVATYGDSMNPWPASFLDFYPNTSNPWARSPLKPGLPLQVFLDQLYGYIFSQAKRSLRTIVVVPEHADTRFIDELENQDEDFSVVPVSRQQVENLANELYHIIQFPVVNPEIWQLVQIAEMQFAKAVGLDDILYGVAPPKQIRSATEASLRYSQASNRAQAMADTVERWMSLVAAKDGLLSRLYVPYDQMANFFFEPVIEGPDGSRVPGGPLSQIWATIVTADSPFTAAADFWFGVESGTGVRKDKQQQIQAAQFIGQTLLPVALQAAAKSGDFSMFNRILMQLGNAMEVDLSMFQITGGPIYGEGKMDSEGNQASRGVNSQGQGSGPNSSPVLQ